MRELLMVRHCFCVEARCFSEMVVPLYRWNSGFLPRFQKLLEDVLLGMAGCGGRLRRRRERQNQRDQEICAGFHQLSIVASELRLERLFRGKEYGDYNKTGIAMVFPGLETYADIEPMQLWVRSGCLHVARKFCWHGRCKDLELNRAFGLRQDFLRISFAGACDLFETLVGNDFDGRKSFGASGFIERGDNAIAELRHRVVRKRMREILHDIYLIAMSNRRQSDHVVLSAEYVGAMRRRTH